MIIIDTHQHFWRYKKSNYKWINNKTLARNYLPIDLKPNIEKSKVKLTIAVQARHSENETEFLINLAKNNPWIAGVIGWIDLKDKNCKKNINYWINKNSKNKKLIGFRHQVQDEVNVQNFLDDKDFNNGVYLLQKDNLIYELLLKDNQIHYAEKFCGKNDLYYLVLNHLGKPNMLNGNESFQNWQKQIKRLSKFPHLNLKISGLVTEAVNFNGILEKKVIYKYLNTALEFFGINRLLFGSDWPVCLLAVNNYSDVLNLIKDWVNLIGLNENEKSALFSENAITIYKLNVKNKGD